MRLRLSLGKIMGLGLSLGKIMEGLKRLLAMFHSRMRFFQALKLMFVFPLFSRKNTIVLRTQLSVRVHNIIGKFLQDFIIRSLCFYNSFDDIVTFYKLPKFLCCCQVCPDGGEWVLWSDLFTTCCCGHNHQILENTRLIFKTLFLLFCIQMVISKCSTNPI